MITAMNPRACRPWISVISALILSCTMGSVIAAQTATTPAAAAAPAAAMQPGNLDSIAHLIAGLPPSQPEHAELAATKTWQSHGSTMQKSWTRVRDGQLAAMKTWRTTQLPKDCPVGRTLFYPFSGPDFLNAYTLFPECDTFIMFGLEPIGVMPDPAAMTPKEFAALLTNVRNSMANLFERNYFVTSTMKMQLQRAQLRGVLPVLMMSMVLSGAEVVGTAPAPFPNHAGKGHKLDGIAIDFRASGSNRVQRVIYYSVDISDKGLTDYPEFLTYLRGLTPTTTLVKAASYLMHIREFSKIRGVLLDTSEFLLQDDTGIPYNFLAKRGFEIKPYGTYQKPIPPFEPQYQPSLATFYQATKVPALPFRFGYHASLAENRSHLMIGRRSPVAQPTRTDVR